MNFRDLIDLCYRNLLRRRTRTVLAVMGVIVGVCAIVVMLSIGFGLTKGYEDQIESYGNLHLIEIYSNGGGGSYGDSDKGVLNEKTLEAVAAIDGVDAVTPVVSEYMVMGIGKKIASMEIRGIDAEVLEKFNYEVQEGRLLEPTDKMGVLFGNQVPYWFYNPKKNDYGGDPEDVMAAREIILTGDHSYGQPDDYYTGSEEIDYQQYEVRAVGVLANPNDESSYCVFMNMSDFEKIQKDLQKARKENVTQVGPKTYNRAMVYVGDIDKADEVSEILRDEMGFQTYSDSDWMDQVKDTTRMIQAVLGGIGAISLIVAALGITNTMIMSIYERTKEIGVMKVIGANLRDIRRMFLIEAGMIGFIGGVVGVGFSILISVLLNTFLGGSGALGGMIGGMGSKVSIIPWWVILGAIAFATVVGIIAGYSPARRAMRLSALESLRNE
ncbi:MAG: ABC transporter permease [Firmicutes bacterium]|nr:ABC transporter permease [Bacillota bacterium]